MSVNVREKSTNPRTIRHNEWAKENPDRIREHQKKYYRNHPEKHLVNRIKEAERFLYRLGYSLTPPPDKEYKENFDFILNRIIAKRKQQEEGESDAV